MRIDDSIPLHVSPQMKSIEFAVKADEPSFSHWLTESISNTNHQLVNADNALQQLASGQSPSLHETMLSLEQAKLSFQYLEQIRNRLMGAYQEILREQI